MAAIRLVTASRGFLPRFLAEYTASGIGGLISREAAIMLFDFQKALLQEQRLRVPAPSIVIFTNWSPLVNLLQSRFTNAFCYLLIVLAVSHKRNIHIVVWCMNLY